MVKKALKRFIVLICIATMLMTAPGLTVLAEDISIADESIGEELIISEMDESLSEPIETFEEDASDRLVPEEIVSDAEEIKEEYTSDVEIKPEEITSVADDAETEILEEVVGEGEEQIFTVGDGVTAKLVKEGDENVLYFDSQGGTLWHDWRSKLGDNAGKVQIVKFTVDSTVMYLPEDSSNLFLGSELYGESHYLSKIEKIELNKVDTSNVKNMSYIFSGCRRLTTLDLNCFNTSNVTDISCMFRLCQSLSSIDVSGFDTSRVTDMHSMFYDCNCLKSIDVSGFDTSNVTDMYAMFAGCHSLIGLDLSSFDTSNVTDMGAMFFECISLTSLDFSSFDTTNVTNMSSMFANCKSLSSLDVSGFNTSRVTAMGEMFAGCYLTSLDLSGFDTSNVTDMAGMFYNCRLTSLDLSGFDTSNVMDMNNMFSDCGYLTSLDLSSFDTSNVTNMCQMFSNCSSLKSLNLSSFDTSNVTDMTQMFWYCNNLISLDLSSFDTSNVEYMYEMFGCCSNLTSLDLSGFDTLNVIDMGRMFYDCCSLTNLNLSSFDMSSIWTAWQYQAGNMLHGCSSLQILVTPMVSFDGIDLPFPMYDGEGNQYSEIPVPSDGIVLTKEPPENMGQTKTVNAELMNENGDKYNEDISFNWGVEKLVYAGKEYDYDLAIAAAYLSQGTYYGFANTYGRMRNLGFSNIKENHDYASESKLDPWMEVGYQNCDITGKTVVCLCVRGSKTYSDWEGNVVGGSKGFFEQGLSAYSFVKRYCTDYNIDLNSSNTIFFLTGHSLGGATVATLGASIKMSGKAKTIIYTYGSPNYACISSSESANIHNVWNEGDPVACLGGPGTSHAGQIIKFRKYIQYNKENDINVLNHDIGRYLYRTYRSAGKMSSLDDDEITYTFKDGLEDEVCSIEPEHQTPLQQLYRRAKKYGTMAKVYCPVNVRIYNADNTLVGDSTNGDAMFTDESGGYIYLVDDVKCVFLPAGFNYRLDISGYDKGTMNIEAMEIDLFGERINSVTYENISIENEKQFILDAQSENTVGESELFVVTEENVPIAAVQTDGTEIALLGSGLVGDGITWSVDTAGELKISGRGEIPSFSSADAVPWCGLSKMIKSVTVSDGITTIGTKAFSNLVNMKNVTVASTVTKIGANVFAGCANMESVLFYGDIPTIDSTAFKKLNLSILYYSENSTWNEKPDLGDGIQYIGYCGFGSEGLELEHSFVAETIEPNSEHIGCTLYCCDTCGYIYATEFLDKLKNISSCTLELSKTSYTYNGKERKPAVTVKDGDATLTSGTDYTVSYADNKNAGTATVKVTGTGVYTGEKTATFKINKAAAKLAFESDSLSKTTQDGAFINNLTATTDGALTYKSSNDAVAAVDGDGLVTIKGAGTATITVSAAAGKNYKAGSASYTLTVTDGRIDISTCTVTLSTTSYTYNGKAKKPTVTVKDGSTTLTSGTDYTVGYMNNTNAGTATVTITGKGNYTGSINKTFTIKKAAPSLKFDENTVSKSALDDAFTNELTQTTDGTLTFTSNDTGIAAVDSTSGLVTIKGAGTAVITATAAAGKNYNAGNASYTLIISPESMEKSSIGGVSLSYGYSGKAYTPTVTVKVDGVTLTKDTDYAVKYENNMNPGTAKITVTGKGKYTGTKTKTFEIVDCVSSVVSGKTYLLIPKNNSKTAVCAVGGKMVNNTKVYITDRGNSESQKFKAVKNSDGTWKFINAKCELALAVQQNSSALGAGLVLYDQTTRPAQNWKLSKKSDNSFAIINSVTGYSIAMSDKSAVKGTTLSMAETASVGLQRFYIVETSAVSAPFDGTNSIRAAKDKNYAVNIASASKAEGANVSLYTYTNSNARKFKIIYSGGGYYRLVNVNSGLCLTIKDNSNADGANIIQSKWKGYSSQRWKITKNSDGTVTITNMLGTVLHLLGNRTVNNTNIHARKAASTTAQKWYLQ